MMLLNNQVSSLENHLEEYAKDGEGPSKKATKRSILYMKLKNSNELLQTNPQQSSGTVLSRVNKRVEEIVQRYIQSKSINSDAVSKQFQKDFLQKQQD